jgi:hypothetical protein
MKSEEAIEWFKKTFNKHLQAGLAEFLQINPNFPRNPMGDFLQYFCERYNFAKTQTL